MSHSEIHYRVHGGIMPFISSMMAYMPHVAPMTVVEMKDAINRRIWAFVGHEIKLQLVERVMLTAYNRSRARSEWV